MSTNKEKNELTLDLIQRVLNEEPAAQAELLEYYDAYITALVSYETIDKNGYIHKKIDSDMKVQLQHKLLEAIKKWKVIL